jgi:hypothetical protein
MLQFIIMSKLDDSFLEAAAPDTMTRVLVEDTLGHLQLPIPECGEDFAAGSEGTLMFSNLYGVVIRVEEEKERIDDSPWVMQPLGRFKVGHRTLEICPALRNSYNIKDVALLVKNLERTGIHFFDDCIHNVGLLPYTTPEFPEGVPVVIDRGGVKVRQHEENGAKIALEDMGVETDPQEKLYGPLRRALKDAWPAGAPAPDAKKVTRFWELCRESVEQNKWVAGWTQDRTEIKHIIASPDVADDDEHEEKSEKAKNAALRYDQSISKRTGPKNPG